MLAKQRSVVFCAPLPGDIQCTVLCSEFKPANILPQLVLLAFPSPVRISANLQDDAFAHRIEGCFPSKKPIVSVSQGVPTRREKLWPSAVSEAHADIMAVVSGVDAATTADAGRLADHYRGWYFVGIRWPARAEGDARSLAFTLLAEHQRPRGSLFVPSASLVPLGTDRGTWQHEANIYSIGTQRRAVEGRVVSSASVGVALSTALASGRVIASGGGKTAAQAYHNARRRLATGSFNKLERPKEDWLRLRCEASAPSSGGGSGAATEDAAAAAASASASPSPFPSPSPCLPPPVAALFDPRSGYVHPAHRPPREVIPMGAGPIRSNALALNEDDTDTDSDSGCDGGSGRAGDAVGAGAGGGSGDPKSATGSSGLVSRLFGWLPLGPSSSRRHHDRHDCAHGHDGAHGQGGALAGASALSVGTGSGAGLTAPSSSDATPAAAGVSVDAACTSASAAACAAHYPCPSPVPLALLGQAHVHVAADTEAEAGPTSFTRATAVSAQPEPQSEHSDPRRRMPATAPAASVAASSSAALAPPAAASDPAPSRLRFAGPGRAAAPVGLGLAPVGGAGTASAGSGSGSHAGVGRAHDGNSEEEEDTNPLMKGWIIIPGSETGAGSGPGGIALGVADVLRQQRLLAAPDADLLMPLDLLPCPEAARALLPVTTATLPASSDSSAAAAAGGAGVVAARCMAEDSGDGHDHA